MVFDEKALLLTKCQLTNWNSLKRHYSQRNVTQANGIQRKDITVDKMSVDQLAFDKRTWRRLTALE
jgi:hypothetical protein